MFKEILQIVPQVNGYAFGISVPTALTYLNWYESQVSYIANLQIMESLTRRSEHDVDVNVAQTSFIVDCNFFDWQLNTDGRINCRDTLVVVYDASYFHCFSFRLPANKTKKIRGLSAVLYLNDSIAVRNNYITNTVSLSQAAGIKLSVHAPGTGSKMSMAEKIGPGMETQVRVLQTKHSRLPAPYGSCSDKLNVSSIEWREGDSINTIHTCYDLCMQQVFSDNCGCLNMEHSLTVNQYKQTSKSWENIYCLNSGTLINGSQQNIQQKLSSLKKLKDFDLSIFVGLLASKYNDIGKTVDFFTKSIYMLDTRIKLPKYMGKCKCT